jgi:hypothetical protein
MQFNFPRVALAAALLMGVATTAARADVKDYEFQLVDAKVKQGEAVIAVKLVHKPSGRVIPGAVIFAKRLDMGPEAMGEMIAPLEAAASAEAGVYRFKTDLSMAGKWALSLGAKVQGEDGTVQSKLIVEATP